MTSSAARDGRVLDIRDASIWARAAYRAAGRPERLSNFRKRRTLAHLLEWVTHR